MRTQDDFDSQPDLDDDVSDGRTLPQYDSEREKLLCEWWSRWSELTDACQGDDYFRMFKDHKDAHLFMPDDFIMQDWKASHIREVVALPVRNERNGVEECYIYLQPKPGCVFKTDNVIWKRFADFSDRMVRKLTYKEGAHRGYTLDEIPDDDDERYLLDGVIPAAELSVIYGAPKAGKSAWTHKLAVAVASDEGDLDGVRVEHGRVLFVTLDPGARRGQVKRRIAAVAERMGVPEVMENKRIVLVDDVVLLDDENSVDHFLQRNPGKFALVVIDPLYAALTGGDPSIAGAMNKASEGIKTIIAATGGALLLLHHSTKGKGDMYGSTFLDAALDARLYVERVRDNVTVTVEVIKNGKPPEHPFTYTFEKEFLAPVLKAKAAETIAADGADPMLDLIPVKTTATAAVRPLIEQFLTGSPDARDQQWRRKREAWEKAGLIFQRNRTIRRVAP